jgi:hypothetical protein
MKYFTASDLSFVNDRYADDVMRLGIEIETAKDVSWKEKDFFPMIKEVAENWELNPYQVRDDVFLILGEPEDLSHNKEFKEAVAILHFMNEDCYKDLSDTLKAQNARYINTLYLKISENTMLPVKQIREMAHDASRK